MGILDALKRLVSGSAEGQPAGDGFFIYVRCRNDHPIQVWVHRASDLAQEYEASQGITGYRLFKHVICPICFQVVRAEVRYDLDYHETSRAIHGGRFMDQAEYDAETRLGSD
jgi:hypothetical protein